MSEYYLADQKAEERARQRELEKNKDRAPARTPDMKFTLLGDFHFPTSEPLGCDPYNSHQGRSPVDVWRNRRDRR